MLVDVNRLAAIAPSLEAILAYDLAIAHIIPQYIYMHIIHQ